MNTNGYFSIQGGKWHLAVVARPAFMHDEKTACGLTARPSNVTWDGSRPDYVRWPDVFCSHCAAALAKAEGKDGGE